jgi:hypothetical protein
MRFACWIFKGFRHTLRLSNIHCSATATMVTWMRLNIRLICTLPVLLLPCLEFTQTVVSCRFWVQRSRTLSFQVTWRLLKTPFGDTSITGCLKELLQHNTLLMEKVSPLNLVTLYLTHILASSCRLDNSPLYTHVIEQDLCPYAKTYLASPTGSP